MCPNKDDEEDPFFTYQENVQQRTALSEIKYQILILSLREYFIFRYHINNTIQTLGLFLTYFCLREAVRQLGSDELFPRHTCSWSELDQLAVELCRHERRCGACVKAGSDADTSYLK